MMNKQLLLTCFLLGMLLSAQLTQGQSYTPLAITSGFNEDVIAEDRPASTYTTAAVDATNSGANNAFMSKNYPDATVGLPENGLIHSIATATPGLTFQLADYDKKNSLKINADNGTGTLTVQTTQKLSILYILATSGSSVSTFTGTITFTDGTQQAFATQSVPDWYDRGTPAIAIMGIGRVPRSGSENPDNNTTNPKLFQVAIDIDMVNQDKIIQQVAVIKTSSTSGFLNIFALSGEITPTCRKPVDLGIQNLTATSVELTWNSPGHAFDIKWGDRNFAVATAGTLVPGFANGGTLTGLTADRDYDYYVRRDCGAVDGVSTWAGPFRFRTGYCIPTGATNNPDEILNFTLSNLNNNSVPSEGTAGYKNYAGTVEPAVLDLGEAYVASLTSGRGSGLHGAAIWIDYNNNLVFDANEQVSVIGNTISPSTTVDFPSFTVPATVQPGLYRLRVQYHHNKPGADLDPCRLAHIYGETEDYRIEIIPTPTCFRPLDSRVQRVTKNSAHVVWDAPIQGDPPALGYKIEVRTSGRPGDATGLVRTLTTTNLSETITGLAIETDYLVYIQSLCSTTDESAWSKVAFTTLCDYPEYELTTDPTDLSFCGSRAVTLEVDTQGIVNWYDSETATTPIHTGNTYTTTVSATSSFWYQVVTPDTATIPTGPLDAEEVGPSRNNWATDWGVYFTILEPTVLKSIDIYPTTAGQYGEMKFVQRGGTGATIGEINYTTVGDLRTEKQVVPINILFEPGDYTIETNLPVDGILRNTADASYPYSSAVASITGNEYQLSYYMGYYNWIFETGCKAIREEVVVTVIPPHSIANASVAVTETEGSTLQITSAASSFTIEYGLRGFEQGTGIVVEGVGHSYGFSSLRGYTAYDVYIQAQPCGPLYGPLTFTTQAPTDTQVITVSDLSKNYGDLPFVTGASDSGLPLSYQVENEAVAVFEQGQLVIKGAGTTRITASQGGNVQYVPAADVVFTLTVNKALLTITAEANQQKTYGDPDPVFTFDVDGLQYEDDASIVTGLGRAAGEAVGTYPLEQTNLTAGPNYELTFVGADFTITEAILTVTADAQTKAYGATDPTLTYEVTGLQNGDQATQVITGQLARQAGESVGTYAINQGSLAANTNYTLVYEGADFTITEAILTVTAETQTKAYGATDPALTYAVSGLQEGDDAVTVLSGSLVRQAGESVGTYAINQGSLAATANYTLVYESADFTITEAILTVTAETKTKAYGATDPALTYAVSGLQEGDDAATVLSGSLVRQAGESVGTYAINQGNLAATANYTLVYEGADFTITEAILTVTADAQIKVYGATDPALTYAVSGLQEGDDAATVLSGSLVREAGESVGTYAINQGNLVANANYTLVYEGADFTISPIELVIYPQENQAKDYGTADPVLTFTAVGLSNGDTLATALRGVLGRNAGENVGRYSYTLGSLESIGNNYVLHLDTTERFEITPTSIDIVVDAGQYKRHGQTDPVLRYTIQGLRRGDYPANAMTGQLEREAGEAVGHYTITQGSLSPRANYIIRSFTTATFEIKRAAIQGLSLPSKSVVYDGEAQYLEVEGALEVGTTVTYENNGQTQVGRYTVVATIANEPNYEPLRLVGILTITPAEQYIRFEAVSTVVLEDTPSLPLQAVASSGLAVTYTIDDPAEQVIAQVDTAGVIHFLKPGFVTVTAHQEGNANYKAAAPVSRTIQVRSKNTALDNLVVDGVSYGKIQREVYIAVGCEGPINSVFLEVETAAGTLVLPSSTIVLALPEYGKHKQEIEVIAEDGIHRETYTVIIEKRMPWEGVLLQKYDNLVFVNNNSKTNGGYVFTKFEWYKNGEKVADKQLFSEGGTSSDLLDPAAEYYAVLHTSRGQVFTTCPMQVTRKNTYAMAVYPNPVDKNKPLTVRFDYPVGTFKTSEYTIYNTLGQLMTKGQLEQAVSVIDLPVDLAAGAYILVIKVDGKPQSVRFIVK
ncbi:MBG domain-containing protein [Myroides sp. C8-3]|uniref:MBG domain-containing protein n=2 Tax=unclassified Myroides TaxID=2642485 RepID=UPI003D2F7105